MQCWGFTINAKGEYIRTQLTFIYKICRLKIVEFKKSSTEQMTLMIPIRKLKLEKSQPFLLIGKISYEFFILLLPNSINSIFTDIDSLTYFHAQKKNSDQWATKIAAGYKTEITR